MKATKIALFFGLASVASATSASVTFNFASLAVSNPSTQSNATIESAIQTYMNTALAAAGCSGCTVTVTGAFADQTWNADNNTTGPGNGSKSLTLGDSNGPYTAGSSTTSTVSGTYDTFLATTADCYGGTGCTGSTATDSQITMKFSGFTINGSASFDYEIFPNASCTALNPSSCGGAGDPNDPDFIFDTNGSSQVFKTLAGTPGSSGDGNATLSPDGTTAAPQYIGGWAGSLTNANELDFVDWPATIGVDNLTISWNTTPSPVPDPSSVLLLGTIVAGITLRKKIRKTA
jgi:hypothetical protein